MSAKRLVPANRCERRGSLSSPPPLAFFSRKISPPAVTRCSSSAEPPGWSLVLREKRGNWCDGRHSSSHRSSLAHSLTRPLTTRHSVCLSRYVSSLIRALAASSLTRDRVHVFASLTPSLCLCCFPHSLTPPLPHSQVALCSLLAALSHSR